MWINETLTKFVESCAEISKMTIYISDLKKMRLCATCKKGSKKIDKIISRELLETLLVIGTGVEQDKYVIVNKKEDVIPLLEDKTIELNINSQIIMPLWADNELKGSLIITVSNRTLDDYDIELTKCMQLFIEESIINSINEEFLNKQTNKKIKNKPVAKKYSAAPIKDTSSDNIDISTNSSEVIDENDM